MSHCVALKKRESEFSETAYNSPVHHGKKLSLYQFFPQGVALITGGNGQSTAEVYSPDLQVFTSPLPVGGMWKHRLIYADGALVVCGGDTYKDTTSSCFWGRPRGLRPYKGLCCFLSCAGHLRLGVVSLCRTRCEFGIAINFRSKQIKNSNENAKNPGKDVLQSEKNGLKSYIQAIPTL